MITLIHEVVQDSHDRTFILTLYNDYQRLMYFVANKCCSDPYDCEEIVQDTVLKLINKVEVLRSLEENALAAYVSVAVRNTAYSLIRRQAREKKVLVPWSEDVNYIPSSELSIEEGMILVEKKTKLLEIWELLSPEDRFLLEGRYILRYTDIELAEELGCKSGSIRMKLTRARRKALKMMQVHYGGDDNE